MLRRLDPETGLNKLFENVSCQGRIQNFFFREGTPIFVAFSSAVVSTDLILSNLSNKNDCVGPGACSPENS